MIYVFTPKRISPDCLFKSIQRQLKISILSPRCAVFCTFFQNVNPLTQWCDVHSGDNFVIECLGEIENKFENTLVCLSGAQMGSNYEKWRSKILRHTPFNKQLDLNIS